MKPTPMLMAMFLVCLLLASASVQAQSVDRVLTTVNPAQRIVLPSHHPSWAEPTADAGEVPADLPLTHLTLVLARSPQRQQAFEKFLQDQQDPSSPEYRHWLTSTEVGERFGVSLHDIAAITQWLQSQNLHVDSVSDSHTRITFSGSASAVAAALGTQFHYFDVKSEKRISITNEPQIPVALAPVIQGIHGLFTLINRPMHKVVARPGGTKYSSGGLKPNFTDPSGTVNYITPGDFAVIYDEGAAYNLNGGSGQMIAIIGRSRVDHTDIQEFQQIYQPSFPLRDPVTIIVPPGRGGLDPGPALTAPPTLTGVVPPSAGDQDEATLDVTRSGSVAPGATVALVISASSATADGVDIATQFAVDANPVPAHIMSISFGSCESAAGASAAAFYDSLFSQGAAEGISIFVSSGDSAAAGCDLAFTTPPASQSLSPNVLCSSGYATCVGGTEFNDPTPATYWSASNAADSSSALSYIPEGAWNEPTNGAAFQVSGTGGGVSAFIPTPSWQTGTGVPAARAGRYTPDVAFSASGHDGYIACLESGGPGSDCGLGGFTVFAGTSAAAPDMAGITALLAGSVGTPLGNLNPMLYKLAATQPTVFHDVTVASSGVAGCVVTTPSMCNNSTPAPASLTGGLSGYLVGTGYDEATGLGSIDIGNLLGKWSTLPVSGSSTTTLVVTANPSLLGTSVTFTATVTTTGATTPTGSVHFFDAGNPLGSGTLSAGVATFTTSTLTVGIHMITAAYGGDGNNTGSTSAPLNQSVMASYPFPFVTSLSPSSLNAGGAAFALTVLGSHFFPTSTVLWNGSARTTTYVNGAELQAAITATDIATAGTASVTVSNPAPSGGVSDSATFAILEAFTGSSGFLGMFVSGGNLGNSALFQKSGLIGFGTTNPAVAMDIVGANAGLRLSGTGTHQLTVTGATSGRLGQDATGFFFASDTNGKTVRFLTNNGTLNEWMRITSAGNVGIRTTAPATALQVTGDIRVGTSGTNGCLQNFAGTALAGTCSSDVRLKTNILPFPHILDKLTQLEPVHFDWNADEYPDYHFGVGRNSGLIAQDVEKVFPEMVTTDAQGYKMVNYSELPYLTLAAIRELREENEALRTQLTVKSREMTELQQQVALVQAQLAQLETKRYQGARKRPVKKLKDTPVTKP